MFPDMYLQYNHPTSKSQQKPFDKNRQSTTTSTTASMPHTLPADHKKTQPPQPSSAALMAHHLPANHHTSHPQKQNGQTASGTAAWSGPGASE